MKNRFGEYDMAAAAGTAEPAKPEELIHPSEMASRGSGVRRPLNCDWTSTQAATASGAAMPPRAAISVRHAVGFAKWFYNPSIPRSIFPVSTSAAARAHPVGRQAPVIPTAGRRDAPLLRQSAI
jgi:hypothetical protein